MKISNELAELVGIIIGDGNIYRKFNKYRIGFTGHPVTDKEYYVYIKKLIMKEWNKDARIKFREDRIEMIINSKEACLYLINELKMPFGKEKSLNAKIPEQINKDWNLLKYFIRGIVDTDGTVFVSKKPGIEKYPSIEITTINKELAEQLKQILENNGFRVSKVWSFEQTMSSNLCYRFGLYGQNNLKKWIDEIGFSNPYKLERAVSYLK